MPSFGIHIFSWPKEAEDVAADRIREASKKRLLGSWFPARESWYQRKCLSRVYFMSPFVIMACMAMIKTKISPAMRMHSYASSFKPTECTTTASNLTDLQLSCDCRKNSKDTSGCKKQYPCFQLSVTIETSRGLKVTTSLYEDMEALSIKFHDCAVLNRVCKKHDPGDTVSSLAEHYATPGASFQCMYNPHEPSEVLLHLVPLPGSFWAMLVTVAILLTLSVTAPVVTYLTCGCTYVCARNPPADIQQEVERRSQGLGPTTGGGVPAAGNSSGGGGVQPQQQLAPPDQHPLLMGQLAPPPPYQQACATPAPQYSSARSSVALPEVAAPAAGGTLPGPAYVGGPVLVGGPQLQAPSCQSCPLPAACSAHRPPPPVILYVHPGGIVSSEPPPGVNALNYQPSPCPSPTTAGPAQTHPVKECIGQHMFYQ